MVLNAGDAFTDEPAERLGLVKQDVVVDILPTSRHGGDADTAHVRSTVVTATGKVITTESTLLVFGTDDGNQFSMTVSVPPGFGTLRGDKEFTVTVLLPRGDGDTYDVELREYSADYNPQIIDVGGRIGIVWRGNGTDLGWVWNYVPTPK